MLSIFQDKEIMPANVELQKMLGPIIETWKAIVDFACKNDGSAKAIWHYAGEKYGWSFRIKNSKRILVYMLPQEGHFIISFVFGQKATDEIMKSNIADNIKKEILQAKVYAEGRGVRITVKTRSVLPDLKELIRIKISN